MLLKQLFSFSLNADRAPQLKAKKAPVGTRLKPVENKSVLGEATPHIRRQSRTHQLNSILLGHSRSVIYEVIQFSDVWESCSGTQVTAFEGCRSIREPH